MDRGRQKLQQASNFTTEPSPSAPPMEACQPDPPPSYEEVAATDDLEAAKMPPHTIDSTANGEGTLQPTDSTTL